MQKSGQAESRKSTTDHYIELLEERFNNCCTAEEQAGIRAKYCPNCERKTIHQFTNKCVLCEKSLID